MKTKKKPQNNYGRGFVLVLDGDAWLWKPGDRPKLLFSNPNSVPASSSEKKSFNHNPLRV